MGQSNHNIFTGKPCGMRYLQLAGPQKKHTKKKIPINLLKDKSAFIPESVCLKSKFEIKRWMRDCPEDCYQNMNIGPTGIKQNEKKPK